MENESDAVKIDREVSLMSLLLTFPTQLYYNHGFRYNEKFPSVPVLHGLKSKKLEMENIE